MRVLPADHALGERRWLLQHPGGRELNLRLRPDLLMPAGSKLITRSLASDKSIAESCRGLAEKSVAQRARVGMTVRIVGNPLVLAAVFLSDVPVSILWQLNITHAGNS
eukprot:COSAG01_NODE_3664_length_5814_cov_15.571829_8_plen_108_part_00